ncbi:outer membrane beta-barrel protein [Deminuibacter soli]|uniref:PorT family protein n=1 Tax=Deminuibacter soli TaxID=2291815 RepID=A0A3E1NFH5_9BACT|nr:outer membrane beta-barrel protein [Deminuibacter soli]RFM26538.1 PorT family protein [Deminuibacter soli]
MPDNQLEKQIQDLMSGFELQPGAGAWTNIQQAITQPRRKRRVFAWWWLSGLLLLGTGWAWFYYEQHKAGPAAAATQTTATQNNTGLPQVPEPASKSAADEPNANIGTTQDATTAGVPANKEVLAETAPGNGVQATAGDAAVMRGQHNNNNPHAAVVANAAGIGNNVVLTPAAAYIDSTVQDPAMYGSVLRNMAGLLHPETLLPGLEANQLNPFQPLQVPGEPHIQVKQPHKHGWQLMPTAGAGVSAVALVTRTANNQNSGLSFSVPPYSDYLNLTPSNGNSSAVIPGATANTSGFSWQAGVLLDRTFSDKWSVESGLLYQYSSFNAVFNYRVPSGQLYQSLQQHSKYHIHAIDVPLLLHWKALSVLGFSGGLMNGFVITANGRSTSTVATTTAFTTKTASIKSLMHTYQPAFYFSPDVPLRTGHLQWRIAPYLQYGIGSAFKITGNQGQRLWQTGVNVVLTGW